MRTRLTRATEAAKVARRISLVYIPSKEERRANMRGGRERRKGNK
jgi:hypothetical protein